jgi:hypothetical protein
VLLTGDEDFSELVFCQFLIRLEVIYIRLAGLPVMRNAVTPSGGGVAFESWFAASFVPNHLKFAQEDP